MTDDIYRELLQTAEQDLAEVEKKIPELENRRFHLKQLISILRCQLGIEQPPVPCKGRKCKNASQQLRRSEKDGCG